MTEQEKRAKVIAELEWVADEANPWKESPPLRCDISYPLLIDALTLLKAREPRVMTLDEVKHLAPDDDVWIEYHELEGWTISAVTVREIYDNGMLCRLQCLRFNFDRYGCYGGDWMAWRCWSSRPTDKQREGTPWK